MITHYPPITTLPFVLRGTPSPHKRSPPSYIMFPSRLTDSWDDDIKTSLFKECTLLLLYTMITETMAFYTPSRMKSIARKHNEDELTCSSHHSRQQSSFSDSWGFLSPSNGLLLKCHFIWILWPTSQHLRAIKSIYHKRSVTSSKQRDFFFFFLSLE